VTATALKIDGLCKNFGHIEAVSDLHLDIHEGQIVGFLGPNGAGKSTTLYMICRLVRPTGGRIEIFGHDVWRDFKNAIRYVGSMLTPSFYEYLSARKNLELIGRLRGNTTSRDISNLLDHVGLLKRGDDNVGTYSQGMKQRLGLAAALVGKPRLLILDEPTNGMDPEGTREILDFLGRIVEQDAMTIFVSSHLLFEVEEFCDTVFVINHGKLVASGQVQDILAPHEDIVYVSFAGVAPDLRSIAAVPGISSAKVLANGSFEIMLDEKDSVWLNEKFMGMGYKVAALTPKQKTLKEFFLSVTESEMV
jgi:ABC-2 type transport system ATP-binding protein